MAVEAGVNRFVRIREMCQLDLAEGLLGVPAKKSGRTVYWHCPFHDDARPSLQMALEGKWAGRFTCFPCGFRGDIVDLYVKEKGWTKRQVLDYLVPLETRETPTEGPLRPSPTAAQFFEGRAWPSDVTEMLDLQLVFDKYNRPRIRFPFRRGGETVYWQDRALFDGSPKWLSHEGICPYPYEVDRIQYASDGVLFVCEGITDTVSLIASFPEAAVVGIPGASAAKDDWDPLFGGLDLIIIGDNDEAGAKFRERMHKFGSLYNQDLFVPAPFNDLDEWRRDDPDLFPLEFEAMVASL